MSGRKEKRRRREEGVSVDARRAEAEFARVVEIRRDAIERQGREKSANRKSAAAFLFLLAGALAAVAIIVLGVVR